MKRLPLSVLGGFGFTFSYAVMAGLLSAYVGNFTVGRWLALPVEWPLALYYWLAGPPPRPLAWYDMGVLIYVVGCDVILYSLVAYLILGLASALRRRKAVNT